MNAFFVPWLKHAGLALSIALGACVNASTLFYLLRKRNIFSLSNQLPVFLLKLVPALIGMSLFVYFVQQHFDWLALGVASLLRGFYFWGVVIGGGCVYLVLLFLYW